MWPGLEFALYSLSNESFRTCSCKPEINQIKFKRASPGRNPLIAKKFRSVMAMLGRYFKRMVFPSIRTSLTNFLKLLSSNSPMSARVSSDSNQMTWAGAGPRNEFSRIDPCF
jgi:hypothetical protein